MSKSKLFNELTAREVMTGGARSGIEASVMHWTRIVNYVKFTNEKKIDWKQLGDHIMGEYCGLCEEYHHNGGCEACPLGKINIEENNYYSCGTGNMTAWIDVNEAITWEDVKDVRVTAQKMLDILIGIQKKESK